MVFVSGVRSSGAIASADDPLVAANAFDSAIALLAKPADDAPEGYLTSAFSGYVRPSGSNLPINLMDGASCSAGGLGGPTIEVDDADFAHDSLRFTATNSSMVFSGRPASSAYTLGVVFVPHTSGAQGHLFTISGPGSDWGPALSLTSGGVQAWAAYGTNQQQIAARAAIHEEAANILIVSSDPVTRRFKVWLNGFTGSLTNTFSPDPWKPFANGATAGLGLWPAANTPNMRFAAGFHCDVGLHTTDEGEGRIANLIRAAQIQYGITLA